MSGKLAILCLFVAAALNAQSPSVTSGPNAPSPGLCNSNAVASFYVRSGLTANVPIEVYRCTQTDTAAFSWMPIGHYVGPSTPPHCVVGSVAFNTGATAGSNLYVCTATDTWTQVTVSGSGTANNLAGGLARQIPYQSAPGTTTFMNTDVDLQQFGAAGNTTIYQACSITATSSSLHCASNFTNAQIGLAIGVQGADATGAALLITTIASVSGGNAQLATPAITTTTGLYWQQAFVGADDTTAIQNWITALKNSQTYIGRTGRVRYGIYWFTSPIVLDALQSVKILCDGNNRSVADLSQPQFLYMGTTNAISAKGSLGVTIEGCGVKYANMGMTGNIIDLFTNSSSETVGFHFNKGVVGGVSAMLKSATGASNSGTQAGPAACGINISTAYDIDVSDSTFLNVSRAICGPVSPQTYIYANAVNIRRDLFQGGFGGAPIIGMGQAWTLDTLTFEPWNNGWSAAFGAALYCGGITIADPGSAGVNVFDGLNILHSSFEDATGPSSWQFVGSGTPPTWTGSTFSVTGGSWSAGVATLTATNTLAPGMFITVTGVSPSGYNVTNALVTAATGSTVSYAVAATLAAWSSGGSIASGIATIPVTTDPTVDNPGIPHLQVGQTIWIQQVIGGTWDFNNSPTAPVTVTAVTSTTISYSVVVNPSTYTSGGYVTRVGFGVCIDLQGVNANGNGTITSVSIIGNDFADGYSAVRLTGLTGGLVQSNVFRSLSQSVDGSSGTYTGGITYYYIAGNSYAGATPIVTCSHCSSGGIFDTTWSANSIPAFGFQGAIKNFGAFQDFYQSARQTTCNSTNNGDIIEEKAAVGGWGFASAYNPATPYSAGTLVTSSGSTYVSLVNSNTGNTPASSPTDWAVTSAASDRYSICAKSNGVFQWVDLPMGNYVPPVSSYALTASVTPAVNLQFGGAVLPMGLYEVTYYITVTSGGSGATLQATFGWTDMAAARSETSALVDASTTNYATGKLEVRTDGVHNLSYSTALSGSATYNLDITVTRVPFK